MTDTTEFVKQHIYHFMLQNKIASNKVPIILCPTEATVIMYLDQKASIQHFLIWTFGRQYPQQLQDVATPQELLLIRQKLLQATQLLEYHPQL